MELLHAVPLILLSCFLLSDDVVTKSSAERSTYIVHMDKSLMPKAFSSHNYWYFSMLKSVKSAVRTLFDGHKTEPKLVLSYDNSFHGLAAVMSKHELVALKK
ncbi:hypothetical protein CDL12_09401 [Handroanthus impetiginosus]|uniref:Inhibitor I9 domain-containing protein n=1 Tax=Handroanthus impetiginosus TaxID=429701 RepID=A0A2G9HKH7_9LAMI|nr:hypothetical protein CDL12_09401 [Handroanthus impetiginosus]